MEGTKKWETKRRRVVMVTRNEMPTKENMLQKSKRANKITRRTTKNQKPAKKVLEKLIRLLMPMVVKFHIIETIFILQEEATFQTANNVLMEHTQDSSIQMSSAIQMPSSNALHVVRIWVYVKNSCGVNRVKSINISNSITSLNL